MESIRELHKKIVKNADKQVLKDDYMLGEGSCEGIELAVKKAAALETKNCELLEILKDK